MTYKNYTLSFILLLAGLSYTQAQHSNELYNDGALIHIQAGAEVHVWGDMHMTGATGTLHNDGLVKVQGHAYGDNQFQQRGTGITRMENSDVNVGERQKIEGDFSVRGQDNTNRGVDDGSFYNLELANDQGIVYLVPTGAGVNDPYVADVRNNVDFDAGAGLNMIVTHDIGETGAITYPANGSAYAGIFGIMVPAVGGWAPMSDNTIAANGNMSTVDAGYIVGKMRRDVQGLTGNVEFLVGLEPGVNHRGVQYSLINFDAGHTYNTIENYFEDGMSNAFVPATECSGYTMDYFGGTDHGQWVFDNPAGGAGTYSVQIWPQNHDYPAKTVWMVTKDNAINGTADQCGGTTTGLIRGGFNGFSTFDVAGSDVILETEFTDLKATPVNNKFIRVDWTTSQEKDVDQFQIERSLDDANFQLLTTHEAVGNSLTPQSYHIDDYAVLPNTNYYYRIKAINLDGTHDYTHSVVASLTTDSGGEEVRIFPNPVSGDNATLEITAAKDRDIQLVAYDAIGQRIYQANISISVGTNQHTINTKEWAAGAYFIHINGDEFSNVQELIKSR